MDAKIKGEKRMDPILPSPFVISGVFYSLRQQAASSGKRYHGCPMPDMRISEAFAICPRRRWDQGRLNADDASRGVIGPECNQAKRSSGHTPV